MRKFDHSSGAFVLVLQNRVLTPDGMIGGDLFEDENCSAVSDDLGEVLVLGGLPGHVNTQVVHDCRPARGGDMTIKSPEYFLTVTNEGIIYNLFEDETGAVVVDDILDTLILNL